MEKWHRSEITNEATWKSVTWWHLGNPWQVCHQQEVLLGCSEGAHRWRGLLVGQDGRSGPIRPSEVSGCREEDKCWTKTGAGPLVTASSPTAKSQSSVCSMLRERRLFRAVFRYHHGKVNIDCFLIWQLFTGRCGGPDHYHHSFHVGIIVCITIEKIYLTSASLYKPDSVGAACSQLLWVLHSLVLSVFLLWIHNRWPQASRSVVALSTTRSCILSSN